MNKAEELARTTFKTQNTDFSIDNLKKVFDEIHEYNKQKRLIGVKVTPRVFTTLQANCVNPNPTTIMDTLMGVYVEVDEKADYPFTPIYKQQEAQGE